MRANRTDAVKILRIVSPVPWQVQQTASGTWVGACPSLGLVVEEDRFVDIPVAAKQAMALFFEVSATEE